MKTINVIGTQYVTFCVSVEVKNNATAEDILDAVTNTISDEHYCLGDNKITNVVDIKGKEILPKMLGTEF